MKKFTSLLLAAAMALSLVGCKGRAPAPVDANDGLYDHLTIEELEPMVLQGSDSASKGAAANLLGELVSEKVAEITGGKLTVQYYPASELGGDMDIQQDLMDGSLDFIVLQTAPTVSFVPAVAVFDLPMVFAKYDGDTIDQILNGDSEFRATIEAEYEKTGMKLMAYLQNGTYRLVTANRALDTLESFKNLKIRTMENQNHMAFWNALDAAPLPLSWGEVYISLSNGTIAAQENAADTCVNSNFQEVQDYLNCTNHILYLNQVIMNDRTFHNMPKAYQEAFMQALDEALAEVRPMLTQLDMDSKTKMEQDPQNPITIVEYEAEFFDEILAMPKVQELYAKIDADVNGLGSILQTELEEIYTS